MSCDMPRGFLAMIFDPIHYKVFRQREENAGKIVYEKMPLRFRLEHQPAQLFKNWLRIAFTDLHQQVKRFITHRVLLLDGGIRCNTSDLYRIQWD